MSGLTYRDAKAVCQRHATRLNWAMEALQNHRPFRSDSFEALTPVELAICDQFVVRFSKLQDAMGTQLLPAILDLTGEPGDMPAFIDKLHRLEKIGVIRSAGQWLSLREMRNQFAHDYPEDPALQASLFNKAFEMAELLLQMLSDAQAFVEKRGSS